MRLAFRSASVPVTMMLLLPFVVPAWNVSPVVTGKVSVPFVTFSETASLAPGFKASSGSVIEIVLTGALLSNVRMTSSFTV